MTEQQNPAAAARPAERSRRRVVPLWKLVAAALAVHAVLILVFSPRLGRADPDSPDALLARARSLRDEGKFETALEIYERVISRKPATPAIFLDAEKEINDVRMKALDAKRKAAEAAKAQPGQAGEKPSDKPAQPDAVPPPPKVDLPTLPDIGGDL